MIFPLLANVYLHCVLDLGAEQWRKGRARGQIILVRYSDDVVVGGRGLDSGRRPSRVRVDTRIHQQIDEPRGLVSRLHEFGD